MNKQIPQEEIKKKIEIERYDTLRTVEEWLEGPVLVLGFIWLILLIVEFIWEANPILETAGLIIWIIFIIDFSLRFFLAPGKIIYLKKNWLTVLSLILPALRIFRIFRVFRMFRAGRAVRGTQLLKVLGSLNRGIKTLRGTLSRRGFIYVVLLTIIVALVGAAGMYAFENNYSEQNGFTSYGDALWWTAMIMTTLGSEAWPHSFEGRMLGFFLSLYSVAVFGYLTATLASYFIGNDAQNDQAEIAGQKAVKELKEEISRLREEIGRLQKGS